MARKGVTAGFDSRAFLATVSYGRSPFEYHPEHGIFTQGNPADSVFFIVHGKVRIVVTSEQGKEAVIAVLGEGDFFGEGCLIAQPLRLATAIAMSKTTAMRIEKPEMIRVLHDEPAFAEVFTSHLLTRNSQVEADLVDHLFNSSEKRLARTLLLPQGLPGRSHLSGHPGPTGSCRRKVHRSEAHYQD